MSLPEPASKALDTTTKDIKTEKPEKQEKQELQELQEKQEKQEEPVECKEQKDKRNLLKRLKTVSKNARKIVSSPLSPKSSHPRPPLRAPCIRSIPEKSTANIRPSIKLRLVTWNMAQSLPSADLTQLLGEVRGIDPATWNSNIDPTFTTGSIFPTFALNEEHPYHLVVVAGQECPTASGVLAGKMPRKWDGLGWTSILESWLCEAEQNHESDGEEERELDGVSIKSKGTKFDDDSRSRSGGQGPYVLVQKDRLLGMYLAVFVARSCYRFVEGSSKDHVTTGLIGGRVGNKGGVGISLKFFGSRLLFIGAHLAAHSDQLEVRKSNIKKIFAELDVDDFLGEGRESRGKSLLERFDQIFFMGDLNMRLNITRLHADWILKTQDYLTALEFDQLRTVLNAHDSPLPGFWEGDINFAPTYKYDIPKKPKLVRSRSLRPLSLSSPTTPAIATTPIAEITITNASEDTSCTSNTVNDDARSIASSMNSKTSDFEPIDRLDALPAALDSLAAESSNPEKKPQLRFKTLVRTNSSSSKTLAETTKKLVANFPSSPGNKSPRPKLKTVASDSSIVRGSSPETPISENPPAIYDTSSKQRVQSYTDRILIRSNVAAGKYQTHKTQCKKTNYKEVDALAMPPIEKHTPINSPKDSSFSISREDLTPKRKSMDIPLSHSSGMLGQLFGKFGPNEPSEPRKTTRSKSLQVVPQTSVFEHFSKCGSAMTTNESGKPTNKAGEEKDQAAKEGLLPSCMPNTSTVSVDSFESNNSETSPPPRLPGVALDRFGTKHSITGGAGQGSITRLKSFLSSISFPFLGPRADSPSFTMEKKIGPRRGEVRIIQYDAVTNLSEMGAISDHRPVWAVVVVGIEEEEEEIPRI